MPQSQSKVKATGDLPTRDEGGYTSEDIHRALFETPPKPRTLDELKQGVAQHVQKKHRRR